MRSISATATPQTRATWAIVMPYFTHARMRASCERGISPAGGERAIAVSDSSGKTGISGEIIGSTRGLRTDLRFREQRFGRLARLHDPLAIITARRRLLLSTKQDFLRNLLSFLRWQSTRRFCQSREMHSDDALRRRAGLRTNYQVI